MRGTKLWKSEFWLYKRVFWHKFCPKFQKPKKDECNTCASYIGLETKTTEQEEGQQIQHMSDKGYIRSMKDDLKSLAKKKEYVVIAAFDLEQLLLCPIWVTGICYYSRRIKTTI